MTESGGLRIYDILEQDQIYPEMNLQQVDAGMAERVLAGGTLESTAFTQGHVAVVALEG